MTIDSGNIERRFARKIVLIVWWWLCRLSIQIRTKCPANCPDSRISIIRSLESGQNVAKNVAISKSLSNPSSNTHADSFFVVFDFVKQAILHLLINGLHGFGDLAVPIAPDNNNIPIVCNKWSNSAELSGSLGSDQDVTSTAVSAIDYFLKAWKAVNPR